MPKLERSLSLWQITLMSIGIILGAGIYVVIGEAAGLTGNSVWISFIIGAVVAAFSGLSYAELASRFPKAGAEYIYIENSFGNRAAWMAGWLVLSGSVIGGATVALGFSRYFSALFNTPILLIAIFVLIIIGIILIIGVQETASLTILFTLIESIGLIIIILIGIPYLGKVDLLEMTNGFKGLIEGGILIFFSYIGFQGIARLAEETKDPEKNIPKAIIISLSITTIIYILVAISAVSIVPWQELAQSKGPLALVANYVLGENSIIILSVIALFSTFNTALVMLLSGSRLLFGIGERKAIPQIFTSILKRFKTPWIAIITIIFASSIILFLEDLQTIANLTNFTIFMVFILINSAVIYYRYKKPINYGFKVPFSIGKLPVIPLMGIITSAFMILNISYTVLILGVILLIIGFVVDLVLNIKYE
jgi:APA family basic amino acid/polyamine antiporter